MIFIHIVTHNLVYNFWIKRRTFLSTYQHALYLKLNLFKNYLFIENPCGKKEKALFGFISDCFKLSIPIYASLKSMLKRITAFYFYEKKTYV